MKKSSSFVSLMLIITHSVIFTRILNIGKYQKYNKFMNAFSRFNLKDFTSAELVKVQRTQKWF